MSWYTQDHSPGKEAGFVVVEYKLGAGGHKTKEKAPKPLPTWKRAVLERLSVLVSVAMASMMKTVREQLVVIMQSDSREEMLCTWPWTPPDKGRWYVHVAALLLLVDEDRASRIRSLLEQEEKGYGYTNSFRFVSLDEPNEHGQYVATAELARGSWKEDTRGNTKHTLSQIQVTTGLQQLIMGYLQHPSLLALPRALRAGVCQEVAQQVMSTVGQLESARVRGEVAFPTVEERDPNKRMRSYAAGIDALVRDVRPLTRVPLREIDPQKYAPDDPRGDRLIIHDERWFRIARSPTPHPIPLFFVDPKTGVRVRSGLASFSAGVSKADRHRGEIDRNNLHVRNSRPDAVQRRGSTNARSYYACLPVLDAEDEEIQSILRARQATGAETGRGIDFCLANVPLHGALTNRPRAREMLIPLSFDRKRGEHVLMQPNLSIAWSKVVSKDGEWYLQLTLRVPYTDSTTPRHVLGISLGLDTVLTWTLIDQHGTLVKTGSFGENQQIKAYLEGKQGLEWDQQKGRWVGGRASDQYAQTLKSIAHMVSNDVIALADHHQACISIEDISWVQKSSANSNANVRFTAWNYGQLRNFISYKAPLAGVGKPYFTSDYVARFTCPSCGAMRAAKDKKGSEKTWLTGDILECRSCGFKGTVSPLAKAEVIARHALPFFKKQWSKTTRS